MKTLKIIILLSFFVSFSCSDNIVNQSNGSLLITANVDVCEFWIFNESEQQIAHAIYDKQESFFFNIPMKEKGIYTIYAEYRKTSINQTIIFSSGIYEYCIEF